jgi:small-conductance mechanosensitive channel
VETQNTFYPILLAAAAVAVGILLGFVLHRILRRWRERRILSVEGLVPQLELLRDPLLALIPAILLAIAIRFIAIPENLAEIISHALTLWIIGAIAWVCMKLVTVIRKLVMSHYEIDVRDNLRARRVQTQLQVLERIAVFVIIVIAAAAMLMTFGQVRQIGVSILASAGIVGIIVGFAAQKSIGTLIAGIQIAITQPIRLDDVVIIENEWGKIEEITLTYVVVRIWDQRRLVVPITHFIEKPFQNWTRTTAELLGSVYLYADYAIPVVKVREELHRILEGSELWDRRVWSLVVTNVTDKVVELRAVMSAADSSSAWNLRCLVREKLLAFLQENFPDALPRVRLEVEREGKPGEHRVSRPPS